MNKKLVCLIVCLQFSNLYAEEQIILQDSALSKFDFSFLPEKVAEFDGDTLKSSELIKLLEFELAKLPSNFLPNEQLKQLTLSFIEKYYQREVNLLLAYESGFQKNEGIAELELELLEKKLGKEVLLRQFEFTGKPFSEMVSFFAEEKVIEKYFKEEVFESSKVNEAEAVEFYFDNQDSFFMGESIKIAQIFVGFVLGQEKEQALKNIQKAMSRLTSGEHFGQIADDYSLDRKLENKGVIDEYFTKDSLRPALKECFALDVGKVSGILESTNGYHIVKVIERRAAGKQQFDDIKPQLMSKLSLERAKQELHKRIVGRMKKGNFKLYIKQ